MGNDTFEPEGMNSASTPQDGETPGTGPSSRKWQPLPWSGSGSLPAHEGTSPEEASRIGEDGYETGVQYPGGNDLGQPRSGWTPPYGMPPPPLGPTTHGYAAGGWGPGGGPHGPGDPSGKPEGPVNRRARVARRVGAGLAVALLVAGSATAGALLSSNGGRGGSSNGGGGINSANSPIPQPRTTRSASATTLNVAAISRRVDPATVDITSVLSTAGEEAEGTGMILTSNGEVLTNNHVIEGATKVTARVDGAGRTYTVRVLGTDPTDDVALVLLEGASGLRHVSIGNSSEIVVGDPVVAIGNALGLGGTPTVTSGTISAVGRSINASDAGSDTSEHLTGLLQTDAPINPGNSGGPLVDAAGQVIGMDTAAANGNGTESATDVGFAIPIDRAIRIATAIQQGKASSTILLGTHGIMGVEVESVAEAEQPNFFGETPTLPVHYGAVVTGVLGGSPAARAGMVAGDVIVSLDGTRVSTNTTLVHLLAGAHAGRRVTVTWVTSNGARHTASMALAPGPAL